ncbi:MAG: esterase family protein [Acidobacteria bacterium]|nr:esterase family protein [Acidobacteriota bacterium]
MSTQTRQMRLSASAVIVFIVGLLQISPAFGAPQQPVLAASNPVETHKLASKLMGRDMPYRVILPADYASDAAASTRYPVLFLLHGLYGHYDNWTDKTAIEDYAAGFKFIIVTPEGADGWYTDSVSVPNDKYESYIVKELLPEVDKKFRTIGDRGHRAIAGLSMGGYGSLKFGLKYPDLFVLAGSFSGALGATSYTEKSTGAIAKSIDLVYGPPDSETRKANDIFKLVRDLTPEKQKALPFIYLDCGTEDFLFQSNRNLDSLLIEKKVPHEYRELPGIHDWKYWDQQVKQFLQVADRMFGR